MERIAKSRQEPELRFGPDTEDRFIQIAKRVVAGRKKPAQRQKQLRSKAPATKAKKDQ